MADQLIKQVVAGRGVSSTVVDDTVVTALSSFLEGEVNVWDQDSTGGTSTVHPTALNRKKISVGKKTGKVYQNCSFTIPHVDTTKSFPAVEAAAKASLNANWVAAVKCDYANLLYDARKEA